MALNYDQYKTQIAEMAVVAEDDPAFNTILPSMIDYAELRIYRDVDLLSTTRSIVDPSMIMTPGDRRVTVPATLSGGASLVVAEQINLILPAGETDPDAPDNARLALTPTTKEFLDTVYGANGIRATPSYYAPFDGRTFLFGPAPDAGYAVEVVGSIRPAPMSATNPTTFISLYMPDLLIMASMIYVSAYQRNFGRQSDDPQMAQSYESQYKELLQSAQIEEARKRYEGPGWTPNGPAPLATPSRS